MRTFLILIITLSLQAKNLHKESYYQKIFCDKLGGKTEVVLSDRTRVDCLTDKYAIEVDFAYKWAEGVGQALHYSIMTGKKAGVYLIIEKDSDIKHLKKLNNIADRYCIKVWSNEVVKK